MNRARLFTSLIFALFISVVVFSNVKTASAQVGISLFPIKFRIEVEAGKTYSDTITVINPNDFSIGVQPEVENLNVGDEGSIDLIDTDIPHGLTAWISINRTSFDLGPQEHRQIPFSVSVPINGEPGGHYGAILFRSMAPSGATESGVGISGRIGSVFLVDVPGETSKTGSISDFTGPTSFIARGPVDFSFKVNNTGNTHFDPEGKITLTGPFIGKVEVPFESRVVFPNHGRTFKASWPIRYVFGPITANLNINIPDSGAQSASLTFFIFPYQEATGIIAILLIIWFGSRFIKRKFKIVRVS